MTNIIKYKNVLCGILVDLIVSLSFSTLSIIGYLKSTEKTKYTGNNYFWDPWDVNVYVSVIKYLKTTDGNIKISIIRF